MGKTEIIAGFHYFIAVRITGKVAIEKYVEKRPLGRRVSRHCWKISGELSMKYSLGSAG